jgi:hypothetical protein
MVIKQFNMKTMKLLILIIGMLFIPNSCSKTSFSDDELSLEKRPYTGNQLRIDGYYYSMDDNGVFNVHFFYKNGIALYGYGGWSNFENAEEEFILQEWIELRRKSKTGWGVFQIEDDDIGFEMWYPSSGGGVPAYIRSGKILNDTTFRITKSWRSAEGTDNVQIKNELYHFKPFSPKPDSTNVYVD